MAWPPIVISTMDPEGQLVVDDDRPDKAPAQVGDEVITIAAGGGQPPQADAEDDQQDHGHAKGGQAADEDAGRQQNAVEVAAAIGGQRAQSVAKDPADDDGRELQGDGPVDRCADDIGDRARVLADRIAEIAVQGITHVDEELLGDGPVGAEQLCVLLVDGLDAGRVAHALRHPGNDGRDRVAGHQARQGEVEDKGDDQGNEEPDDLAAEISAVLFQRSTSSRGRCRAGRSVVRPCPKLQRKRPNGR